MKKYIGLPTIILLLMFVSALFYDYTIDSDPIQKEWRLEAQRAEIKRKLELQKASLTLISNLINAEETFIYEKTN